MSKVDQFESQFRAAAKETFRLAPPRISRVQIVTDLEGDAAVRFQAHCKGYLASLHEPPADWVLTRGAEFGDVRELLGLVERHRPDLICTYRHLHSGAWRWPHSLGEFVDVLTQVASCPVLLMPHPGRVSPEEVRYEDTHDVLAITDHLTGDAALVNHAAAFVAPGGVLHLTHVEDRATFDRYMTAIEKIPAIDTDTAREEIERRLLKDPADYIESCRRALTAAEWNCEVVATVTLGARLDEHRRLIEAHGVDLLVMHTRDADQMAMHGLAYPLAVELRDIPILLL